MATVLDVLRKLSHIDCDTLDSEVARELGPFVDCTSNQAIAFFELSKLGSDRKLHHDALIKDAVAQATSELGPLQDGIPIDEFVVEVLMVKLQLLILPYVRNYVHVQTNPKLSHSKDDTIRNARRVLEIFKALAPKEDSKRVCIKIPATWEGLQACRVLEAEGIATLATTMFCMEQAILAADANCTYIAPYLNELRVHFDADFQDEEKAFNFCLESRVYYEHQKLRTRVLVASFTCVPEILALPGSQHLTISPAILDELVKTEAGPIEGVLRNRIEALTSAPPKYDWEDKNYIAMIQNEEKWTLAFAQANNGRSKEKLDQAVSIFSDFQKKIESLLVDYIP